MDSHCPGGLCEQASCRTAAGVCTSGATIGTPCGADSDCGAGGTCGDDDSSGEGFCPAGPIAPGSCSVTTFQPCVADDDCRPSGSCPFCASDDSEPCLLRNRHCFPSTGYTRIGTPGFPDRVDVAHFCFPGSSSPAVNATAGLSGPGALELPVTAIASF